MTFIFLSADALDEQFLNNASRITQGNDGRGGRNDFAAPVRRPHRGIQIKEDTYATLSVVDGKGNPIPLVSESYNLSVAPESGRGEVYSYADFIMQTIAEERSEKQQIVETFGDSFIFFFGERPRTITIQGLLVNTEDFNWRSQFWYNYDNFLRGSKLVQRNARAFLSWDQIVVEGYPLNASAQENANDPYTVQFSMTMFVTNYQDFSRIGELNFPPEPQVDFDAANSLLDDERSRFISTTLEVRALNIRARAETGGGIGGFVREGIRSVNSAVNLVSNFAGKMETILSGRVVTKPLGMAGFIAQLGPGFSVAAGSVNQSLLGLADFTGLTDTKLKIPHYARFTQVNENVLRGRISLNVDEYPTLGADDGVFPLKYVDAIQRANFEAARERRKITGITLDVTNQVINASADAERAVVDTIVDVIQFAKTGFAMINTIKSAVKDPGAVAADSLGVSGIDTFNIGTATPI